MYIKERYQVINPSTRPIEISLIVYCLIIGTIMKLNNKENSEILIIMSLIALSISIYKWSEEILSETKTSRVNKGIHIGLILFIISEVCIFLSLFFTHYYNTLIPSIELSNSPIYLVESLGEPIYNTLILFLSGICATVSLYLFNQNKLLSIIYLISTIVLGMIFSKNQYLEYRENLYTISDSTYGTIFYTLTGFHGIHVIVGIILLSISLIRILTNNFSKLHFNLYNFSNIYWHFVDYVWIILFIILYL